MAKKSPKISIMPLGDRILVKPEDAADDKSPSGIYIPETARKEKPETGTVVAVGPGKRLDDGKIIPVAIKVGDTVMFSKYGYEEVKSGDEEYYIVNESSVLAVIK